MASGRYVVLDLNGKTIDRGLTDHTEDGYAIKVLGNLTITGNGTITGGNNVYQDEADDAAKGGGVYISSQ